MKASDYISATDLSKKTSATLNAFENGQAEKLIVLKNNSPKAVLLSMQAYEELEEELENLRLKLLASSRLDSFEKEKALSHEQMLQKFG